jgi:hypothetical protein
LLYPKQWNEKQADVMVHLPDFRLMQTALPAAPRRRVHGPGSGLNTGDKKTHQLNPWDRFCTAANPDSKTIHYRKVYTTEPDDSVNNDTDEIGRRGRRLTCAKGGLGNAENVLSLKC